jgi:hypothetical protein
MNRITTLKVMTIADSFKLEQRGFCIVGINRELDSMSKDSIVQFVGRSVYLRRGDLTSGPYKVLGVDVMVSITGKKNIAIKLPDDVPEQLMTNDTEVLADEDT